MLIFLFQLKRRFNVHIGNMKAGDYLVFTRESKVVNKGIWGFVLYIYVSFRMINRKSSN